MLDVDSGLPGRCRASSSSGELFATLLRSNFNMRGFLTMPLSWGVLLLASGALGRADESTTAESGLRLGVGESATFRVAARAPYNSAGVCLERGAHYQFTVAPCDTWQDAKIVCGPDGWTRDAVRLILRPLVRAAEPRRRCAEANWFELVGSLGCDGCAYFRIGCRGEGWTYSPCRDGPLYAFANDAPRRYDNNSGSLLVTVTRVAAPERGLPSCGR